MEFFNDDLPLKFPTGVYLTDREVSNMIIYSVCAFIQGKQVVIGAATVSKRRAYFYRGARAYHGAPAKAWRALVGTVSGRRLPFDVESVAVDLPQEDVPSAL